MKYVIALAMVGLGLGIEANGSQTMEIALGLCFFFGAVHLVRPAVSGLSALSHAVFPAKHTVSVKRVRR